MDATPPLELDLRGLRCPMPVLRTRKAMRRLAAGKTLRVLCTDPLAGLDIPNLAREDGYRLLEARCGDGVSTFVLAKSDTAGDPFPD